MKSRSLWFASALGLLASFSVAPATATPGGDAVTLVEAGAPTCKLVTIADTESDFLLNRSADLIADTIYEWSGVKLPRAEMNEANRELSSEQAIVFATLGALKKIAPDLSSSKEFAKAAEIDEQGFVCVAHTSKNARQLFVVSQTPRGVYNGAVYLRDFWIDGTKHNLTCEFRPVVRTPKMGGRATYTLTIWGNEAEYTPADWEKVFERFANDGVDRIYFWVSGHFPSKKYPQTYRSKTVEGGKTYDTTVDSKIGTVEDLQKIVHSAHKLGMKIYLGGGLGCWCGTIHLTHSAAETLKRGPKEPSLCPSNAQSRQALVEYYQELFAALPEADGLFIESADEVGACDCATCGHSLDKLGSKQFGQAQLSLCQEIMNAVWRDHPQARLAYTIGYPEHVKDVAYYNLIQRMSKDPRFEWMEARKSWSFPGPNGEPQTPSFFSNQVMRWKEYHITSVEDMVAEANRIGKEGMYGMILSFSPGFTSGSFYKDIPFPTDILPYALTGFVFREATWNPDVTAEGMVDLTQQRFFGKDAPRHLAADLWKLREMIRTRKGLHELNSIEDHIKEARESAGPKTMQGLNLMTRAVDDLHRYSTKKRATN
jgi:hypothetical protein